MTAKIDSEREVGGLRGKVVLVTGAGRGLGASTAMHLAAAGARVVVNYLRDADAARAVVQRIGAAGGAAFAVQADVRDAAQTKRMVALVQGHWQAPEVLVLNADVGGFRPTAFAELEVSDYHSRTVSEISAAVVAIQAVLPAMKQRGQGCILAMSSALARTPVAGFSTIAVSKGALEALVRALAVELGPHGIRVNTIEASMIEGPNSEVVDDEQREWMRRAIPLGRVARPDDVASVVTLLASDGAAFINGATIPVNGGQVLY